MRCGRLVGRAVAVAPPFAPVGRPVEDRRTGQEDPRLALRGVDPLALAGALAVIERAEQRQRVAVGAHPVEIGIAPADRHRRLGQPRHVALPAKGCGHRPDGAHPAVGAVRAHAGLLDVDDVGPNALQHVVAEPQALQHAGRKPLGDDVADPHQVLGDLQSLRMADVQRDAAFAGILVVELAAHVGVAHAGQRPGRGVARGAAADRRHRREAGVGIVLPFDLEALGAHRGQKTGCRRRRRETRRSRGSLRLAAGTACCAMPTASGSRRGAARPARSGVATLRQALLACLRRASGARRPTCQLVLLLSHLLVG